MSGVLNRLSRSLYHIKFNRYNYDKNVNSLLGYDQPAADGFDQLKLNITKILSNISLQKIASELGNVKIVRTEIQTLASVSWS